MHTIDLGSSAVFKVLVNGREIELREPLTKELKEMASKMKEVGDENSDQVFVDFVVKLGMPKDVADSLGAIRLKKMSEGILGGLSEKK